MNALNLRLPVLFLTAALFACTTKEGPTTTGENPSTSAAVTTPAPGATTAAAQNGFGLPLAANKCPSAAPGSTTTVAETADGVEVTVIAPGGTPINDIRQRGVQIVAAQKDSTAGNDKDGLAKCPILVKDSIITETDIPGGAKFTIKPKNATGLADLKKETKARAATYTPEAVK